jgi:tRNA 2-thiouridine synthesizing protein B
MLHLVFQSPIEPALLERLGAGDDVLFLENSLLQTLANSSLDSCLSARLTEQQFYVLADDLTARGISVEELISGITAIDFAGFVDLSIKNAVITSWI